MENLRPAQTRLDQTKHRKCLLDRLLAVTGDRMVPYGRRNGGVAKKGSLYKYNQIVINSYGRHPPGANSLCRWRDITTTSCDTVDWVEFCYPGKPEAKFVSRFNGC